MRMENHIVIHAPAQRIFACASDTERWPDILPHYRYVRTIERSGSRIVLEMAACRPFERLRLSIPVRWQAEQVNDAAKPQISFRHIRGWTRGMQVYWRFTTLAGGATRVEIDHELHTPLAQLIGRCFVDPIATRTLQCMKRICEDS